MVFFDTSEFLGFDESVIFDCAWLRNCKTEMCIMTKIANCSLCYGLFKSKILKTKSSAGQHSSGKAGTKEEIFKKHFAREPEKGNIKYGILI